MRDKYFVTLYCQIKFKTFKYQSQYLLEELITTVYPFV